MLNKTAWLFYLCLASSLVYPSDESKHSNVPDKHHKSIRNFTGRIATDDKSPKASSKMHKEHRAPYIHTEKKSIQHSARIGLIKDDNITEVPSLTQKSHDKKHHNHHKKHHKHHLHEKKKPIQQSAIIGQIDDDNNTEVPSSIQKSHDKKPVTLASKSISFKGRSFGDCLYCPYDYDYTTPFTDSPYRPHHRTTPFTDSSYRPDHRTTAFTDYPNNNGTTPFTDRPYYPYCPECYDSDSLGI